MTATTTNRTRTTRKIIGSLGIIGAAAAVAGMGTFGTFTDSTAPLNASVASGTLSLDLNATNSTASLPLSATGFVPGDTISRSVDLVNSGDLAFSGIQMTSAATTSSLLDTDKVNGLQLSIKKCTNPWTESLSNGVATYTCSGTVSNVVNAPAVASGNANVASVNPGGIDHLVVSLTLPTNAGNEFQGQTSKLAISFSGTQRTGTNR
ncbi:M73 family metallopeptidase [Modestobacter italicus]|uniref:M73 family metallopeptidase n=1 Tax=Modestobacter italicus (strain DSM 44449 / CECT 9708 / BC 501) TaxID=2732864 RepID=UPI001C961D31|nr:M73 family metallopeptidase [Modestobacter italicus]